MDFSVTSSSSTRLFSKGQASISSATQQGAKEVRARYESYGQKVGTMSSVLSTVKTNPVQLGEKAQQQADAGNQAASRSVDRLINVIPISVNSLS